MPLWLIPTIYAVSSIVAGLVVPRIEMALIGPTSLMAAASAQAYLSSVASGMMALTGIVFSIAFVLVQFNAVVYSPRLVIWFARDRLLFHALGMFVATFMFSLATLGWIDRAIAPGVPVVSAALVFAMLIASVIMLTLLVQRLNNLQITRVLQTLGTIGRKVIAETYRVADEHGTNRPERPATKEPLFILRHHGPPCAVTAIDHAALAAHARHANGTIVLDCMPGSTLLEGQPILTLYGANAIAYDALRSAIALGEERTFEQDPAYPLRLLVDIAIKALSPAINDPTTAVQALDQIEDLLRRLARCDLDDTTLCDTDGTVRVVLQRPSWEDYLAVSFDEIRQFGATSLQVMRRLHAALSSLAETVNAERAPTVRAYLRHLNAEIDRSAFDRLDRASAHVDDRQGLGGTPHPSPVWPKSTTRP